MVEFQLSRFETGNERYQLTGTETNIGQSKEQWCKQDEKLKTRLGTLDH